MWRYNNLTVEDISRVGPFLSKINCRTCDFTVGGMFMWRDFYKMEFAIVQQAFYSRLYDEDGKLYYNIPLCDDIPLGISTLLETQRNSDTSILFCTVPENYISIFQNNFDVVAVEEEKNKGDYLYLAEDLINLSGKKFSGQRNQIHQFNRSVGQWSFEIISNKVLNDIIKFFNNEYLPTAGKGDFEKEENIKTLEVLQNYLDYGMIGGVLRADGNIVGFSLNEIIGDTMFTHIEKASKKCKGAYQMLVNQSAIKFTDNGIKYINREEDMGDPGLQTAKNAYHPVAILKKYKIEVKL